MMAQLFCKCCGRQMHDFAKLPVTDLTNRELLLLEALVSSGERFQTYRGIAETMYADDPQGGPLDVRGVIRVVVHKLRSKLQASGWIIESRHGQGYRLIPSADETAGA